MLYLPTIWESDIVDYICVESEVSENWGFGYMRPKFHLTEMDWLKTKIQTRFFVILKIRGQLPIETVAPEIIRI